VVGCSRGSSYGNLAYRHPDCDIAGICDSDEAMLARHQRELGLPDRQCFGPMQTW